MAEKYVHFEDNGDNTCAMLICGFFGIDEEERIIIQSSIEDYFGSFFGQEIDVDVPWSFVPKDIVDVMMDAEKDEDESVMPDKPGPYVRIFDECSSYWINRGEINLIFVQAQENYFNHRLQAFGHVFLNEVYDALGIPRCSAGAVVGWLRGEDKFIEFKKLYDFDATSNIVLDFNVQGIIYNQI